MRRLALLALALPLFLLSIAVAQGDADERWTFDGIKTIEIDGVSGDVAIKRGSGDKVVVELDSDVSPDDAFRADVDQDGKTVVIDERWRSSNRGSVKWTLSLPDDDIRVEINTASGSLTATGVKASIRFESASGDIELTDVELGDDSRFSTASGDYDLSDMKIEGRIKFSTASGDIGLAGVNLTKECKFSTASGDVEARECAGAMRLSTASGDVDVKDCKPEGECKFSSASGDVSVSLDALPPDGLEVSSASGDVSLKVNDFGDDFTLELIKREGRGHIRCPFDYTTEETFWDDHHEYERKVVERGSGKPHVTLRTASGKVTVRK